MIPIDEVVYFDVTTHRVDTGAVTDGDSAPTFDVFEEATDTPILDDQTMTKRTALTGNYRGAFTASTANGFEAGKWYSVVVSATVNGVSAKFVAKNFRVSPAESSAGVPKVDVSHIEGADATDQIRDAVVDDATRIDASALNTATGTTIPAILVDTAEIGAAGAGLTEAGGTGDHLTAIDLPDQTMNITGNITGNLSGSVGSVTGAVGSVTGAVGSVTGNVGGNVAGSVGSVTGAVGSVTGAVGSVTGNVGGNVTGSIGSLATQAKSDVNNEVVDALTIDVVADSVPTDGSRPTIAQAVYLLTQFLTERSVSGTTMTVRKPDGSTSLMTFTLSDATSPTSITRAS